MRLLGGQCNVSLVGSGLYLPASSVLDTTFRNSGISLFNFNVSAFSFLGKGSSLSTYPVASSATSTRFPPTFSWLDSRMSQYRAWMNLKLNFKFPRVFGIVVDQDAVSAYSRIFSSLIKVTCGVSTLYAILIHGPYYLSGAPCCSCFREAMASAVQRHGTYALKIVDLTASSYFLVPAWIQIGFFAT